MAYFIKVFFFPSDKDRAEGKIAALSSMVSFEQTLNPLQVMNRLKSLKDSISFDLSVDAKEFIGGQDANVKTDFTIQDINSYAPLFFQNVSRIKVLTRDFKVTGNRTYQLVVVAEGQTRGAPFDHAYLIEISFDQEWKLSFVKILAPPN